MSFKIALGDLRHSTVGRHSVFMPLGIGHIASYLKECLGSDNVDVRLYTDPDKILEEIEVWRPNVVGLSNYCWNAELSRIVFGYAKKINPETVCIAGGPDFPTEKSECMDYLRKRNEIDFYVYLEGEVAFAELTQKIWEGADIDSLKGTAQVGVMSLDPKSRKLVAGEPSKRNDSLDKLPSPYLTGIMDQWFDGDYAPSIETIRGCPYSCAFCYSGNSYYTPLNFFSLERVEEELTYIAYRIKDHKDILLSICDDNFGMYERDEKVAAHIRKLQDEYGWPVNFDVATGKSNHTRILDIASLLQNRMNPCGSVQSLHPPTLKAVKRVNLSDKKYLELLKEIKRRGFSSIVELIAPLPEETKESFMASLKKLLDAGADAVTPYTTMLLKGTRLDSKECRQKYEMQSKFRILPRQFGEYKGEKCFEIEEVCVSTNTMPYEDYLEVRGFAFISTVFSSMQYDIIYRLLQEMEISSFDCFYHMWESIKSNKTPLSKIYYRFLEETDEELWDSPEEIYDYFGKPENYDKLVRAVLGDNLIRKYRVRIFIDYCIPSYDLVFGAIRDLAGDTLSDEKRKELDDVEKWVKATRNIGELFDDTAVKTKTTLSLDYDVNAWYCHTDSDEALTKYKKSVSYSVFIDQENNRNMFDQNKTLFGDDLYYRAANLFLNYQIKDFWRRCELVEE